MVTRQSIITDEVEWRTSWASRQVNETSVHGFIGSQEQKTSFDSLWLCLGDRVAMETGAAAAAAVSKSPPPQKKKHHFLPKLGWLWAGKVG